MRRPSHLRRSALLIVVCLSALAVLVAPAQANDFECNGTVVGPGPTATFDNVVVPPGGVCTMQFVTIRGSVKALENSRLNISDSTIHGNIQGEKSDSVELVNNEIRGSVQIKEGGPADGLRFEAAVCGNLFPLGPVGSAHVRENIQIEKMTSTRGIIVGGSGVTVGGVVPRLCRGNEIRKGNIEVKENHVTASVGVSVRENLIGTMGDGGNLQVFKNTGTGQKDVNFNTVSKGTIQCYDNQLPFNGTLNTGKKDPPPNQCLP